MIRIWMSINRVCPRIPMIEAQKAGSVRVDYDFTSEAELSSGDGLGVNGNGLVIADASAHRAHRRRYRSLGR